MALVDASTGAVLHETGKLAKIISGRAEGDLLIENWNEKAPGEIEDLLRVTQLRTGRVRTLAGDYSSFHLLVHGDRALVYDGPAKTWRCFDPELNEQWSLAEEPDAYLSAQLCGSVALFRCKETIRAHALASGAELWRVGYQSDPFRSGPVVDRGERCYIAQNGPLVVHDIRSGEVVAEIARARPAAHVACAADRDRILWITSRQDEQWSELAFFDARTFQEIDRLSLPWSLARVQNNERVHRHIADSWTVPFFGGIGVLRFDGANPGYRKVPRPQHCVRRISRGSEIVYQLDFGAAHPDEVLRCAAIELDAFLPTIARRHINRTYGRRPPPTSSTRARPSCSWARR